MVHRLECGVGALGFEWWVLGVDVSGFDFGSRNTAGFVTFADLSLRV